MRVISERLLQQAFISSGLAQFHNVLASDVSGTIGEFTDLNVDVLNARTYKSTITTSEHFEIVSKQIIAAVSQFAGAAVEGAVFQSVAPLDRSRRNCFCYRCWRCRWRCWCRSSLSRLVAGSFALPNWR